MYNILDEYKNFVVTVTVPHLGCALVEKYLRDLACTYNFESIPPKASRARVIPSTKTFVVRYESQQVYMKDKFVGNLTSIFNSSYLTYTVTEENRFRDLWQLFTHLLTTHDWHYQMSDDHSVWRSGESAQRRINTLYGVLQTQDRLRADDLYNAHSPFGKKA